jgi:hypothetical protein
MLIHKVCLVVFNAIFNNISVISWRSVLLVEETEGPEKTADLSQVTDKLYHIILYTSPWSRFELTISVMTGTDCIGNPTSSIQTFSSVPFHVSRSIFISYFKCDKQLTSLHLSPRPCTFQADIDKSLIIVHMHQFNNKNMVY